MLGFLKTLVGGAPARAAKPVPAPAWITLEGGLEFPIAQHLAVHHGYPIVDWEKARSWVDGLEPESRRAEAWTACERAWLLHFRDALGSAFRLDESDTAALVSSLEPNVAHATLEFMARTMRRIGAVLEGIVQLAPWGKDILIAFDDEESYYRYVSYYYPERGEFAFSGGMHIGAGCSHFVTVKRELRLLEATIVHEMTHASLEHLPLPVWLNEGLAVNTERRLAETAREPLGAPEKLHDKLRRFGSVVSIQEFWSGIAFHIPESQNLSYELARILVAQLARDWQPFAQFVLHAERADAGAAAAREYLGLDLGELVTALLERDTPRSWSPDPSKWEKP
ncbi:MAG TPA: hypothetical protein VNP36_12485 [Burkholderiales bacterium]|nr:hypothetical protein [Burkholderiales bacterium]